MKLRNQALLATNSKVWWISTLLVFFSGKDWGTQQNIELALKG
jgi:hypothetical protein